jgi:BirA family biotin operon repressor/biotin-[acetyl-CoA-carboxylase] ligase
MVSILSGLGIVERLDAGFPGLSPALKWPNDIVAGGLKLGGVLAEASWQDAHPLYLVVGVGLNIRPLDESAPAELEGLATAMESLLGEPVPFVTVADRVIEGLELWLPRSPVSLTADLLSRVDRYDWLRDRRARLTPPGAEEGQPGTCVGIAPDGALLFRPDQGALRRVTDGVVDPWAASDPARKGEAS